MGHVALIEQGPIVYLFFVNVLSLIFLLINMSGWCYNMNSKSLGVIADWLMADEALLL